MNYDIWYLPLFTCKWFQRNIQHALVNSGAWYAGGRRRGFKLEHDRQQSAALLNPQGLDFHLRTSKSSLTKNIGFAQQSTMTSVRTETVKSDDQLFVLVMICVDIQLNESAYDTNIKVPEIVLIWVRMPMTQPRLPQPLNLIQHMLQSCESFQDQDLNSVSSDMYVLFLGSPPGARRMFFHQTVACQARCCSKDAWYPLGVYPNIPIWPKPRPYPRINLGASSPYLGEMMMMMMMMMVMMMMMMMMMMTDGKQFQLQRFAKRQTLFKTNSMKSCGLRFQIPWIVQIDRSGAVVSCHSLLCCHCLVMILVKRSM